MEVGDDGRGWYQWARYKKVKSEGVETGYSMQANVKLSEEVSQTGAGERDREKG